jgi:glucose-6-phosphate isomerase
MGALRKLAEAEGYRTFVIPDDVGGRYSVLTPVGLLPIAIAGFNIRQLVEGARQAMADTSAKKPFDENPACQYAAARNVLYNKGKKVEIMVNYTPKLHFCYRIVDTALWRKRRIGDKGYFPAGVVFTPDLHQWD